ncbi:MAG: serine--tRNA ligase, partial [Chloroflexi bacterium]|nr:serine--tRNA ligase [Chloroflexota bacterium]
MLDIKLVRENPDIIRQALEKRGDKAPLDQIIALDKQHRQLLHEMESLRAKRNEVSKQIS